jgi:oxygen-dependent protoporphyrinogen oxidase
MTAAIIGGGIAGLAAAYELVKAGERPYILEPGAIGGMVRSTQLSGFTLELGPNVLVERPEMTELFTELGLSEDARYPSVNPYGQYVWYAGNPTKVPAGLLEFISSPLFSWSTKLGLPIKVLLPRFLGRRESDCSVGDFFRPLIGDHAVKHLLDPVLKGIYGGDVYDLSARALFPGLWTASKEGRSIVGYMRSRARGKKPPIMILHGGLQKLTQALWGKVRGHVEHIPLAAEGITPLEGRRYTLDLLQGKTLEVDGCVITTAGKASSPLIPHLSENLSEQLARVRRAGLTVVHLAVPRSEPLVKDAFGVLFPGGMPCDLLGVMFNSLIFPHVAPADEHVLTVMLGGAQAGDRLVDEETLRKELPALLSDLLGVETVKWIQMCRWPAAIPQLAVGHYQIVKAMDACERDFPGIVFAGVDRGGVGVSERIRIAREAVKRLRRARVETVV